MQSIGSHPGHHIRLNSAARVDIMWWFLFAEKWNGISLLWDSLILLPEFNFFQMLLVLGVVEVTGAYIGFSLNGPIIYVPSKSPPKNSYQSWWQQQYLPISGRVT